MAAAGVRAVGVDFGTSTSLVAERVGSYPVEVLPLGRTTRWLPSIAGFREDGTLLIGEDAETLSGDRVIRSVKQAITDSRTNLYVPGDRGSSEIPVDDVIVAVLAEIGQRAAAAGLPLSGEGEVRLGCPAMWDGNQRRRLLELAVAAGLSVDSSALVDEPIAAGIAWVTHRFLAHLERPAGRLLVFDMGGGTLDIAVLDVEGGERPEISVLSALGAKQAGDVLDRAISADLANELSTRGFDIAATAHPSLTQAHLLRAARDAKVRLSQAATHPIVLPRSIGQAPVITYTREQLEVTFRPQMDQAVALIWAALRAAMLTERGSRSPEALRRMGPDELTGGIDYVLLAGGMSRIPYVERRVGALFPHAQIFDDAGVAGEEAIVAGLADTGGYERLNLHRPGFDFVLEWKARDRVERCVVYSAHTPFYEPWQVLNGQFNLGYEWRPHNHSVPHNGDGVLRIRSTSGEHLSLTLDGRQMDGFRLRLGARMAFKLYCNGQILIRDGIDRDYLLRVDRWPVIRGRDHARLVLRSGELTSSAAPVPWYLQKDWAPPRWQV